MSAPYLDHLAAIRAALNVDARSLYKPASWQKHVDTGYRELHLPPPGDLSRLERFEQDCLTYAFLRDRLPSVQWAVIIVRHSLRITDPQEQRVELDRLRWAVWTAAGQVPCDDVALARWGVMRWGGKLAKTDTWQSRWGGGEVAVSTLKRHYRERVAKPLDDMLAAAERNASRLLSDAGLTVREAA